MSSTETKMYTLKSMDNETFEVEESVALMSQTIKYLIEDSCTEGGIPLSKVAAVDLAKVIEFCKKHANANANANTNTDDAGSNGGTDNDLKAWDKEFIDMDMKLICDLILAANYLEVKELLELGCQAVADKMKSQSVEWVREVFGIENDFTPEEEEKVRKENAWAFEK